MKDKPLIFEEFCKQDKRGVEKYAQGARCFYGWFVDNENILSVELRRMPQYQKFEQRYPEFAKQLTALINRR